MVGATRKAGYFGNSHRARYNLPMPKRPKRKPSHERIAIARDDIEVAEELEKAGNLEMAAYGYRVALEELEGMSHYDHIRQDILLRLAYLCLQLDQPDLADDYAIKSCALIKDPAHSEAVYSAFEAAWHECFPFTPEEPIPGIVVPFRRPSEPPKSS